MKALSLHVQKFSFLSKLCAIAPQARGSTHLGPALVAQELTMSRGHISPRCDHAKDKTQQAIAKFKRMVFVEFETRISR